MMVSPDGNASSTLGIRLCEKLGGLKSNMKSQRVFSVLPIKTLVCSCWNSEGKWISTICSPFVRFLCSRKNCSLETSLRERNTWNEMKGNLSLGLKTVSKACRKILASFQKHSTITAWERVLGSKAPRILWIS